MKSLLLFLGVCLTALLLQTSVQAQNVFSGEPVQWVGRPNGYSTTPYNSDYRTMGYRKISTTVSNPSDGRGQWATTINVQSSGGNITPDNMPGGPGAGWLLISGPSGNRFQNKWNFGGIGQGALHSINNVGLNQAQDMGLDMGTAGRYTFVFKDAGYTASSFYVGYTSNAPVAVTNGGTTFSNSQPVITITTSASPSSGENIYVRYRSTTNDFTTGTSVVQATGSGTAWTATLPQQTCGSTVFYYIYTSTRTLAQINADSESDRSLASLRYDDAFGSNYSFTVSPVPTAGITNNSGTTVLTCSQTSISVTATGGASYSWDNGLGSGASKSITSPGTYTVTVTGANGCTSTAQIVVTQNLSNNTFSGTGNWTDNARWSCGTPPGSGSIITIAAGANVTLNTDFTVAGSLTMTATSTLTINPTRTLSVSGTANFAAQSVILKSDNTGTASIGQVTGTVSNATNITIERFIPNNGFRSWRLLSVPTFGGQTIRQAWQEGDANPLPLQNNIANYGTQITGVFTTQVAAAAAGFDSTSVLAGMLSWTGTAWANVTATNQSIVNSTKSWFLYIRGERSKGVTGSVNNASATTLRTKGTVYTGDQVTSVGANAFGLIPNVYPSAINFTGLTRTGGVNNLFYIWDSKKQNGVSLGVYQTFSNTNSFNCLIGGGSYTLGQPNTTIESGQAFFVTSGASGSITLKESAKVSGTNGSLGFRPSAIKSKIDSRLYNSSNEMLDANTVVFDAAYSKSVSEEDAPKFGNPGANFAIETNSKLLAIEGTQPVTDKDAIQFRIWNLQQGTYKFEFEATNLNAEGLTATLEDSYLKTSTALSLSETITAKFTVDANAGSSAASRFKIVFAKAKPAIINSKQTFTIAPNPIENGVMNVQLANQPAGKYSIRIICAGGQTAAIKTINHAGGNAAQVISLPTTISRGTYTVEIIAPDKTRTTQTVMVNVK